ncbi:hypothetical protein NMY22_g7297 [Coprinellus aureogranulatus]|nr:hypothetical protein NMY22_g7297 [Coprinellus aureogranulatus]
MLRVLEGPRPPESECGAPLEDVPYSLGWVVLHSHGQLWSAYCTADENEYRGPVILCLQRAAADIPQPLLKVLLLTMSIRIVSAGIAWLYLFAALGASVGASPAPVDPTNSNATDVGDVARIDHTGRATWFNVGLGNCGKVSKDSEPVVAIGKKLYDQNGGSNCGQWVEIINTKNNKKAYGQVWDSCPGCTNDEIDLSPSLFQKFAPLSDGIFTAQWHFKAKDWKP